MVSADSDLAQAPSRGGSAVRVTPDVIAVAQFLHDEQLTSADFIVDYLERIDRKHPGLSFAGFLRAVRISYLAERTRGRA